MMMTRSMGSPQAWSPVTHDFAVDSAERRSVATKMPFSISRAARRAACMSEALATNVVGREIELRL